MVGWPNKLNCGMSNRMIHAIVTVLSRKKIRYILNRCCQNLHTDAATIIWETLNGALKMKGAPCFSCVIGVRFVDIFGKSKSSRFEKVSCGD